YALAQTFPSSPANSCGRAATPVLQAELAKITSTGLGRTTLEVLTRRRTSSFRDRIQKYDEITIGLGTQLGESFVRPLIVSAIVGKEMREAARNRTLLLV